MFQIPVTGEPLPAPGLLWSVCSARTGRGPESVVRLLVPDSGLLVLSSWFVILGVGIGSCFLVSYSWSRFLVRVSWLLVLRSWFLVLDS